MKLLLILLGVCVAAVITDHALTFPRGWLEPWNRWDAPHYIDVAVDGYVKTALHAEGQQYWIVFFPLYPWLIRAADVVVRDAVVSAQLISLIAAIAAAILLQRLIALDFDRRIARLGTVFLFIFPTAYFLHAGYTESLFIACALACVLAARRGAWSVSATAGAVATLTRVNGLLLLPVMMIEACEQYRRERTFNRGWLLIPLAATGFAIYLGVNAAVYGDPFYFQAALHEHWGKKLTWPWIGIVRAFAFRNALNPARAHLAVTEELIFLALGLMATIAAWKRLRPSYAVWMTLNWLLVTSTNFIQSVPRYLLTFFPMFILFALLAEKRRVAGLLLAVASAMFLAIFATFFSLGIWAF